MRFFVRVAAVVTATVFVATLVGCTPDDGPPGATAVDTPVPSISLVFGTEEQALKAASAAFQGYNRTSDQISRDGGANPDRISKWVTSEWLNREVSGFMALKTAGTHITGSSSFDSLRIQKVDDTANGGVKVTAYLCLDISRTKLRDSKGADVTPKSQPDRIMLQVEFASKRATPNELLVARSEPWTGENECA